MITISRIRKKHRIIKAKMDLLTFNVLPKLGKEKFARCTLRSKIRKNNSMFIYSHYFLETSNHLDIFVLICHEDNNLGNYNHIALLYKKRVFRSPIDLDIYLKTGNLLSSKNSKYTGHIKLARHYIVIGKIYAHEFI